MAGGTIDDPVNGDLEEGWSIQPTGSIDPIHAENGDTVAVTILFTKAGATVSSMRETPDVEGDWWADVSTNIPGGDYVGGKWHVVLSITGEADETDGGDIIAAQE